MAKQKKVNIENLKSFKKLKKSLVELEKRFILLRPFWIRRLLQGEFVRVENEAGCGVERLVVDPHHESPAGPKGLELLKRHREVEVPKEDLEDGIEVDMTNHCPLVLDRIHRLVVVGLAEIPEDFMEKKPLVVARAEDLA